MSAALLACLALTGYVVLQPETEAELSPPERRVAPVGRERSGGVAAMAEPDRASAAARDRTDLADALAEWRASRTRPALPAPDAQSRHAWAAQQSSLPPAPVDAAEPPAPIAPPFPYAWVGRYLDPLPRAIIAGPMVTWVKSSGDVLEGQWRIDAIDERQMTLTFLPLGQSQTVAMK